MMKLYSSRVPWDLFFVCMMLFPQIGKAQVGIECGYGNVSASNYRLLFTEDSTVSGDYDGRPATVSLRRIGADYYVGGDYNPMLKFKLPAGAAGGTSKSPFTAELVVQNVNLIPNEKTIPLTCHYLIPIPPVYQCRVEDLGSFTVSMSAFSLQGAQEALETECNGLARLDAPCLGQPQCVQTH